MYFAALDCAREVDDAVDEIQQNVVSFSIFCFPI